MKRAAALLSLAVCLAATEAAAQVWIGLMAGSLRRQFNLREGCGVHQTPPSESIEDRLRLSDQAVHRYWNIARASTPVDLSSLLAPPLGRWVSGGKTLSADRLNAVTDPVTAKAVALDESPVAFEISGDELGGSGIWRLTDASGAVAGWYIADWSYVGKQWTLVRFEVQPVGKKAPSIDPFCHKRNDGRRYKLLPRPAPTSAP